MTRPVFLSGRVYGRPRFSGEPLMIGIINRGGFVYVVVGLLLLWEELDQKRR